MSDLEILVLQELNLCRADPRQYAAKLEKTLKFYKGNVYSRPGKEPIETEEGRSNVQSCISLLKSSARLPTLTASAALSKAASLHAGDLGQSGQLGHVGSDGSSPEQRIERFALWQGHIGENIDYGNDSAEDIVISLLVDDGVADRAHRLNILSPDHLLAGAASAPHSEMGSVCVILFAQALSEKPDEKPAATNKKEAKPPLITPKPKPKAFDPSEFRRPGYTDEDIVELKEAFDLFDADKSGGLNPVELRQVIEDFGFDAKNLAIFQLVSELDTDGSGKIEFKEFIDMISGNTKDENSMEEVRKVFNVFDADKTGFITIKNLRQICNDLGEQYSDDTLKNLIEKGDSNSDGLVSFEDFYYIMTRTVL
jgi:centrin-1